MGSNATTRWMALWSLLASALLLSSGCAVPIPRIDPTGERLLTWGPAQTTVPPPGTALVNPPGPITPGVVAPPPAITPMTPPGTAVAAPNYGLATAPGDIAGQPGAGTRHGCGHQPHFWQQPGHKHHYPNTSVMVGPKQIIAPVGTEVVVQSGVCGKDGHLMANQRVEWTIAPGSVGHFVEVDPDNPRDWLNFFRDDPKKVDATYAVGVTSSRYEVLNRGTPEASDDIAILRGQAWTTVTSPIEGTSHVTAMSPDVYQWERRKATATIHWIDAQWALPPSASNPAGTKHMLTTLVTRRSNGTPLVGWLVRYEIAGGPPAGFAPDGAQAVEVTTNSIGQASIELFQLQPTSGTNTINVQIIRPGNLAGGDGTRLVMGSGVMQKTWTSPDISLDKTGPAEASVGATVIYRIVVANPGDLPARDVIVTDDVPSGFTYLSSNPQATISGGKLTWQLGTLRPRESRVVEINLRADQQGVANNCATVRTADGLTASDCAATTVVVPTLEVTVVGPTSGEVGQQVQYVATISNRGNLPATNLVLVDRFDPGLQHSVVPTSPIERDLGTLQPGQTVRVNIDFRLLRAGRWCHTVEVRGQEGTKGSAQACIDAREPAGGVPLPSTPSTQTPPATGGAPRLTVTKTGPAQRRVGEVAEFNIDITNTGNAPATNLKVTDSYDLALDPVAATDGYAFVGDDLVWRIDTLPPGRSIRMQVNCRCLSRADRACNRVSVTADQAVRADHETCLQIQGGTAALSLQVFDLRDPVASGNDTTYEVTITNNGQVPDQQVVLVVTVPPEMAPLTVGVNAPSRHTIAGQVVRFAPVAEIRPGERLVYQIPVRAVRSGDAVFRCQVTSANSSSEVTGQETTTIFNE